MSLREIICAWCKRAKQVEDGKEQTGYPSHGICDECRRRLLEQS